MPKKQFPRTDRMIRSTDRMTRLRQIDSSSPPDVEAEDPSNPKPPCPNTEQPKSTDDEC